MYKSIAILELALRENRVKIFDLIKFCRNLGAPFRAHPLGFISCTFLSEGARNARLHIWPLDEKTIQDKNTQIHDHIFDFTSWVIHGGIINTTLTSSAQGELYALYSTSYSDEKSTLHKTNFSIQLSPNHSVLHLAGTEYSVKSGEFHKSERAGSSIAATVLITNQINKSTPSVAGSIDGPQLYEYQRVSLSETEIDKLVLDLKHRTKTHQRVARTTGRKVVNAKLVHHGSNTQTLKDKPQG